MRLVEPRPLFRQSKIPIQAELFSCHMKQDLIERFKEKKKEYRYVLRHIDKMDGQHRDWFKFRYIEKKKNGLSCNYKSKNF